MKKIRGLNKYFKNLYREAHKTTISISDEDWYDLWHTHPDWLGHGNISLKSRKQHLEVGLITFENLLACGKKYLHPYQCWMLIDIEDSSQDAIYFNTKNPQQNVFPYDFSELFWTSDIPQILKELMKGKKFKYGYSKTYYNNIWIIEQEIYS